MENIDDDSDVDINMNSSVSLRNAAIPIVDFVDSAGYTIQLGRRYNLMQSFTCLQAAVNIAREASRQETPRLNFRDSHSELFPALCAHANVVP